MIMKRRINGTTSVVYNQSSPESKTVILGAPEVYVQVKFLLGVVFVFLPRISKQGSNILVFF